MLTHCPPDKPQHFDILTQHLKQSMFGLSSLLKMIHNQLSITQTGWCDELYHCHLKFRHLDAVSSPEFFNGLKGSLSNTKRGTFLFRGFPKCPPLHDLVLLKANNMLIAWPIANCLLNRSQRGSLLRIFSGPQIFY